MRIITSRTNLTSSVWGNKNRVGDEIPSKPDILLALFQFQQQTSKLMFDSDACKNQGNLTEANVAYEGLVSTLKQQLWLIELSNLHYPDNPIEVLPIINQMLNALLVHADVLEALGFLDRAEKARDEAMRISEKHLPTVDVYERGRQLAASLVTQGRFNEALVALFSARDLFQEQKDPLKMANITANIAGILEWLGDYDRAIAEVNKASKILEPLTLGGEPTQKEVLSSLIGGRLQEAECHAKLLQIYLEIAQIQARINRCLGNYPEAERMLVKILPKVPRIGQTGIKFQLAAILVNDGRYEEGLEYLKNLEPMFKGLLRPKWGVLLSYKAEALLGLGHPNQALGILNIAIQDLSTFGDMDSLWKTEWRRARAFTALDRPVEALNAYSLTAEKINSLRKAPLGYRLDSTYLRDKLPVFEAAVNLACELDEAEICCRLMEMIKSRILTATLSISDSEKSNRTNILESRVDKLSRQIDTLEYIAYQGNWTKELDQRKQSLQSTRADLIERIRFSDPRWRSLSEPVPFDLENILDLLAQRNQAALTLFYQPHQVICILLKDRKCRVEKVELSIETKIALQDYTQKIQSTRPKAGWFNSFDPKLKVKNLVSDKLLKPALQSKGLIIVPHRSLHLLPWAGLPYNEKRLFEFCPVGIIPNLNCVQMLKTDFSTTPRVGLIGAPDYSSLPGLEPLYLAQDELMTIQNTYPSSKAVIDDVYMAEKATEKNFWKLAKNEEATGNILHIACHGTLETGDPLNSGLLLTDAKVDAAEIARSRIQYDEVILSACSTGYRPTEVKGVELSGDDIIGLPGAFLEAGARSVLVSVPKAREDVTLEFMTIYHENRTERKPPMMALKETQEYMLSTSAFDIGFWIGFTVYGCQ